MRAAIPERRRAVALRAHPVARRAGGGREVAGLPERQRHQPQHGRVARLGVARVDQPACREREVALREGVLGRGHEALDALGAGIRLREVDELQRSGRDGADAQVEAHPCPLLDVVAAAGEVDAVDGADTPLGVREAPRVPVDHRVVRHTGAERVVLGAIGIAGALPLFFFVGALPLLGPALAGRCGADLHRVARDLAAARLLGELLERIGRLVDRLQVALVLELPPRRGDVGMPELGQPPSRELDVALPERRFDLEEQDGLLDVQHLCHDPSTVAGA